MTNGRRLPVAATLLALALSACATEDAGGAPADRDASVDTAAVVDASDASLESAAESAPESAARPETSAPPCPPTSLVCDSFQRLPETIKEAGFFPAAPDFTMLPTGLKPYQPNWELWSDGLAKKRYVFLPPGTKIDISDRQLWVPPAGTIFVKTFLADGPTGAGTRPVETRIIRRTKETDPLLEYEFAVYQWNQAGTDAKLLDIVPGPTPAPIMLGGQPLTHQIPSRAECDKCHVANDTVVIGFDELRLNWKLPGAATTQLETFAALGAFSAPLPANPERISVPADPLLEQVEGFVEGNCAHCHNGLNSTAFDLRYRTFVANTVGQKTMGSGTNAGLRVDPGRPDNSVLYRQMARVMLQPGFNPMPPVGVQRVPQEALATVRQWITALKK